MIMVSEAAEKIQKLPKGMHYRLLVINFHELNSCHDCLCWIHKTLDRLHRVKVVRNPSEENSGNTFVGKAYWRSKNQTLQNNCILFRFGIEFKISNETKR